MARGPHLEAMRHRGLRLVKDNKETVVRLACTNDPQELGPQDYVIVGLKAHQLSAAVPQMQPLLDRKTAVVTAVNGIPYGTSIATADALRAAWSRALIPAGYSGEAWARSARSAASSIPQPKSSSLVSSSTSTAISSRSASPPASAPVVCGSCRTPSLRGMQAPVLDRIHDELWLKLWGNLSFNPISALAHATLDVICTDEGTRAVARQMMVEAQQIAVQLGVV